MRVTSLPCVVLSLAKCFRCTLSRLLLVRLDPYAVERSRFSIESCNISAGGWWVTSKMNLMSNQTNREIHLVSHPKGLPTAQNFALVESELKPLEEHQVLVRNLYISVDPYMRGRMNGGDSYVPPFEIGQALTGGAVGEVIESRDAAFIPGDIVTSQLGWREFFVGTPEELHAVDGEIQPRSIHLGVLGMTGMTAWAGLNLVDVKAGDTVYISGAAGAVGSVAGQLAKLRGCRVIGSAGSDEKTNFLLKECHFDAAFNYKSGPVLAQLQQAAPEGIDVYFDNVGDESLVAALTALRVHGRIIACGGISNYNHTEPVSGPPNLVNMVSKRLTMKGLIVTDSFAQMEEFEREVGELYQAGKLINKETVAEGLDAAVGAFIGLFTGENIGKMVVKLP